MKRKSHRAGQPFFPVLLFLVIFSVTACSAPTSNPTAKPIPSQLTPTALVATSIPLQPEPTQTPVPLAAEVNGEGIPLAEYQASLAQLQAAQAKLGKSDPPETLRQKVLDDLTGSTLLAQAAFQDGYQISESDLDKRIARLAQSSGGEAGLSAWETSQRFTSATFRQSLKRALAANWKRDQIFAAVPRTAEQVHARQILVYNKDDADRALGKLIPGIDFATLAYQYDPVTGGDLGWFPIGYLTDPAVESAAFSLQPGEISPVIEGKVGFHIIQVIERDPQRLLSPDARLALQQKAFQEWVSTHREQSKITIIVP